MFFPLMNRKYIKKALLQGQSLTAKLRSKKVCRFPDELTLLWLLSTALVFRRMLSKKLGSMEDMYLLIPHDTQS
jgi:hypothetical protein